MRDERAAPLFTYLVRHMNRRTEQQLYQTSIEALGTFGGPDAVEALKFALGQGDLWAPLKTRRLRAAAAQALRQIGTPAAIDVLREASTRGPRGVRAAARAQLPELNRCRVISPAGSPSTKNCCAGLRPASGRRSSTPPITRCSAATSTACSRR